MDSAVIIAIIQGIATLFLAVIGWAVNSHEKERTQNEERIIRTVDEIKNRLGDFVTTGNCREDMNGCFNRLSCMERKIARLETLHEKRNADGE